MKSSHHPPAIPRASRSLPGREGGREKGREGRGEVVNGRKEKRNEGRREGSRGGRREGEIKRRTSVVGAPGGKAHEGNEGDERSQ